jgi:hypothetical protein
MTSNATEYPPGTVVHRSARLHCFNARSDKIYHVDLVERDGRFYVHAEYGPRGGWTNQTEKIKGGTTSLGDADRAFSAVVQEKTNPLRESVYKPYDPAKPLILRPPALRWTHMADGRALPFKSVLFAYPIAWNADGMGEAAVRLPEKGRRRYLFIPVPGKSRWMDQDGDFWSPEHRVPNP